MGSGRVSQIGFPPLTNAVRILIAINVGVFFVNLALDAALIRWLGLSWSNLTEWYGLGALRLLTSQFVHSYDNPWHLIGNMVFGLWMFGSLVEAETGRRGLVKLFLLSGLTAGVVALAWYQMLGIDPLVVGASGGCYGLIVYGARMHPRMPGFFGIELRWLAGILVMTGVYMMILEARHGGPRDGVAHSAHIGGALCGWIAFGHFRMRFFGADSRPWFGGVSKRWSRMKEERRERTMRDRQATLDTLLDKVHREGMGALTGAERRILERASKDLKRR